MTVLVLSTLAFLHFAFCSRSLFRQLNHRGRTAGDLRVLQCLAWGFLVASMASCISRWTFEIGLTTWFGMLTASALLVTAAVTYRFQLVSWLWHWSPARLLLARLQE